MAKIGTSILVEIASMLGGSILGALRQAESLIKSGFRTAVSFHQEGIAFAREMGMSAKEAQAYTEVLTDRTEKLAIKYGVAAEQVRELQRNISVATSRQLMLNDAQAEQFLQLNKLVGANTVSKFTEEMMNGMGAQLDTVTGAVSKAYATAAKSGLNAQKVSEKIASNLNMANKLSFRTGIDGLTRMAMQAEKVGMNLQSVEAVAKNFLEIDDAIANSARLQMLGGSAAIMGGNPLDIAFEANNDPEALQKRMIKMLGGYAQFDAQKGIANINGINMDFVRNIAKAMGISEEEAARISKKNAELGFKERRLGASFKTMYSQEEQDFLMNKSYVKNGQVYITDSKGKEHNINGGRLPANILQDMMKYNGMSDRDIMEENARNLTSINEQLSGIAHSIAAQFGKELNRIFPGLTQDIKKVGAWAKTELQPVAVAVGNAVKDIIKTVKEYKEPIKTIAKFLLGTFASFIKFAADHWKLTLAAIIAAKGIGGILGMPLKPTTIGGRLASGALRGVGNGIKGFGTSLWSGIKWVGKTSRDTHYATRFAYSDARAAGGGRITSALKAPFGGLKYLNGAQKIANIGGAALGVGIGAYNAITADNAADRGAGIGTAIGTAVGAALGGPVGAAIGGFLGDFGGRWVGEHWDDIVNTVSNAWDGIKNWFTKAWDGWLGNIMSILIPPIGIIRGVVKHWDDISKWVSDKWGKITSLFGQAIDGFMKFVNDPWGTTKNLAKSAYNSVFGSTKDAVLAKASERHANGGIVGTQDNVVGLAKGEIVLSKTMQENLVSILKNPLIQPKAVGEREYIYTPRNNETSNVNGNTITVKDFNINLSGTLRLDGGNSSKNIDVNELLRDQAFVTALKDVIKNSINHDINGGRFMNDLATMGGFPSQTSIYARRK